MQLDQKLIDQMMARLGALETERSTWIEQFRDLSRHFAPRYGRFLETDRNQGRKVHQYINDATPAVAARTLAAGFQGGSTSPARPWFKLSLADQELADYYPVKRWLAGLTRLMLAILSKSGAYGVFQQDYLEAGVFGTTAGIVLPDFSSFARFHHLTTGEYSIGVGPSGKPDVLYRKWDLTVSDIVKTFGIENVSMSIKNLWDTGKGHDQWRTVVHVIEPREDRDAGKIDARNMAFRSTYFEYGCEKGKVLRDSGFKRFPGYIARWDKAGGDIYGNSPAMLALGDAKQLQFYAKRRGQVIDYRTKPPLAIPARMKNDTLDLLPGGKNYVNMQKGEEIRSAFNVDLGLPELLSDIQDLRERIRETMFTDLFLMLANIDHTGMTATEIALRQEEKLLMLGPVAENLQQEKDSQVIDLLFDMIEEAGFFKPGGPLEIPAELQREGQNLEVEFVGVLAQAQRAVASSAMNRGLEFLGAAAALKPDVVDKVNLDEAVDRVFDGLGIDPAILVPDDEVAAVRDQRNQQQQQMQDAAVAAEGAKAVGAVSKATGATLDDMISQFSGYGLPQGSV